MDRNDKIFSGVAVVAVFSMLILSAVYKYGFSNLDIGFWGAILGAMVGGIIAMIIKLIAINEARNERLEVRKQQQ